MAFKPIPRMTLAEAVFEQVAGQILNGDLAAGDALPSERVLAEAFDVNRQAVREGLKRLAEVGLIEVGRGSRSRVLDWRQDGGLALLPKLLVSGGVGEETVDPAVARSIVEMRACIGPDVARLCAERALPETLQRLVATSRALAATEDLQDRALHSWEFWTAIVEGADNIAYQLALNSLRTSAEPLAPLLVRVREQELRDTQAHRDLAEDIAAGRSTQAEATARRLLSSGVAAVIEMLSAPGPARETSMAEPPAPRTS